MAAALAASSSIIGRSWTPWRLVAVVVGIPLNAHLENDLPAIAARVTARTRAIYIVNPHNPTGTASETLSFKAFLAEMAKQTTVIVDEAYLEFEPDNSEWASGF
ncbi:aminotransferase class I/II-fold pyridoxal phosphate-dependent enzyme [Bradyrhizobium sp. AZCC 2289]|uniref:aminotransferase class I/II-fold pyridoxal phosphate-dependent enzyme n=1 Tax=Bradyrhizobium sp. AZCC 2289 TaxID=3117026 RepID=UPI002FEFB1FA